MAGRFFFKNEDFANPKLQDNPEQIVESNISELASLKQILSEKIDKFIEEFPWYKKKDGKKRAETYRNEIQSFEGSAMDLLKKVYDDINKAPGEKPLETSKVLREALLFGLCEHLNISEREIKKNVATHISPAPTLYINNAALLDTVRFQVMLSLVQKHAHLCELKNVPQNK